MYGTLELPRLMIVYVQVSSSSHSASGSRSRDRMGRPTGPGLGQLLRACIAQLAFL